MAVDLRKIANGVASDEGLGRSVGGSAQVAEIIALLGIRWRRMGVTASLREFWAIRRRAGGRSQHG